MRRKSQAEILNQPGMARARALIKAVGYDSEDLRRPRIGVANTWSETSPGHSHLRAVADAVKAGIWQAGGTPCEFGGFGMCPVNVGSAGMRYDTPTRDIIAADVETCAELHSFDGLVLISSNNYQAGVKRPRLRAGGLEMGKEMIIRFVAENVSARVLLLEQEAPRSCAALWRALPVSGEGLHAAYSGTEIALHIDPSIDLPEENATECIQTGDVMYTHYKPGVRHGFPEAGSAIHWAYDRYVRPTTPGQWTPAISNIFGRIIGDAAAFYDVCRRMRREGAKQIEIRAARSSERPRAARKRA